MRYALLAAPLLAAVYAQDNSTESETVVPLSSGSTTISTTVEYSNPATLYLTQTNSLGVVTGMPGASTVITNPAVVTSQPAVVTTQPAVDLVPAGITGTTIVSYNGTAGFTSFTAVAGESTTRILGGANTIATVASGSASGSTTARGNGPRPTGGRPTGGSGSNSNSDSDASSSGAPSGSASSSSSSASESEGAAASNMKAASAGVLGLGAFIAALL
ncbi:hypothetical protein LTR37_006562 [Vermiconidia calcicola]|uniref:Uncharacterized protein n=1 Tax=Vermiconidia calcicola TaxID=1690605 RepID=A0ACC3NHL9_9PEZI|nr:hypothetical protein LTR37_006562 [Vermiconidia calcicola]